MVQAGLFIITNGITKLGSGASTAVFNLGLELTSPEAQSLVLSQFTFTITHTPNLPDFTNVPDTYAVTFTTPPPTTIAGHKVWFDVVMDPEFSLSEGASTVKGALYVHFSPVPEPATYGAAAGVLLAGVVWRRRRRVSARQAGRLSERVARSKAALAWAAFSFAGDQGFGGQWTPLSSGGSCVGSSG